MSQNNLFKKLVESLSETELYELARLFLKHVEGLTNIIICNGPWDSGIDLVEPRERATQYQATIESKKIEAKVLSDVNKAKRNVDKFSSSSNVTYFYSRNLSNKTQLELKKESKDKYDIILRIVDGNELAQTAATYDELAQYLIEISKIDRPEIRSKFFESTKAKAFYDLMSFGSSTDIKHNIIKSFVLNLLVEREYQNKQELLEDVNKHFKSNIDPVYFNTFIHKLSTDRKVKVSRDRILITDSEKKRILDVVAEYQIEEEMLLTGLLEILQRYSLNLDVNELLSKLVEVYESNYSINLEEFTNREFSIKDLTAAKKQLVQFIQTGGITIYIAEKVAGELISATDQSEILPKIAAGKVYSKVSEPQKLEAYVIQNISNKKIFIDANVLIYLILVHYEETAENPNTQFRVAKQFLNFSRANNLYLKTIQRYIAETSNIFRDAVDLLPFTRLDIFKNLGEPSNIIYKHFMHLKESKLLSENTINFEDFLKEFGLSENHRRKESLQSSVEYLLDSLGIAVENIAEYDTQRASQIIAEDSNSKHKTKSANAIANDAAMFCMLGDRSVAVNPLDPIFCTWDYTLFQARKSYFSYFPNCTQWFQFTPSRLMDHFAMMKFQVRPGSLSNELLSLIDHETPIKNLTDSLLDAIVLIINPKNEAGLKYTNKLGELRRQEIMEMEAKPEGFQDVSSESNSVDVILLLIITYFFAQSDKKSDFKNLFTQISFVDEFTQIIHEEKEYFKLHGKQSENLIPRMDSIIEKAKIIKKSSE